MNCATLVSNYHWDCSGCICPGDDESVCGDGFCNGNETADNCEIDCDIGPCSDGYLLDCSGDADCCPSSWIGDGYGDCDDQEWGCDLTCYDCDGGDCPETDPGCEEADGCCTPGDYNCDASIDVLDVVAIVNCILEDSECPCGDLDGDSSVNVLDIVLQVNIILGVTEDTVMDID